MPSTFSLLAKHLKKYQEPDKKDSIFKTWIFPGGSLIIAALTLFSANYKIPVWAVIIFVVYLISSVIIICWQPFKNFCLSIIENRRYRNFAKTNYSQLFEYAESFLNIIDYERINNMGGLLKNILNYFSLLPIEQTNKDWYHNSAIIYNLKEWHLLVLDQIREKNYKDFIYPIKSLQISIKQFHNMALNTRIGLEGTILKIKSEPEKIYQLKTEWNSALGEYMDFVRRWQKFGKEVNERFGETILLEYFDPLKPL